MTRTRSFIGSSNRHIPSSFHVGNLAEKLGYTAKNNLRSMLASGFLAPPSMMSSLPLGDADVVDDEVTNFIVSEGRLQQVVNFPVVDLLSVQRPVVAFTVRHLRRSTDPWNDEPILDGYDHIHHFDPEWLESINRETPSDRTAIDKVGGWGEIAKRETILLPMLGFRSIDNPEAIRVITDVEDETEHDVLLRTEQADPAAFDMLGGKRIIVGDHSATSNIPDRNMYVN